MTPELQQRRRVDQALADLLDLNEAERAGALSRIAAADAALARELRCLLDLLPEAESYFERFDAGLMTAKGEHLIGRRLGAYRVIAELGRGGMGAVYRAERADGQFERQVAIKIVSLFFAGGDAWRQFEKEKRILSALKHPHIAQLLDAGSTEEGIPYLVMELVEGIPIDRYAAERRLSRTDRLKLFLQVCEAVQYAHSNLVVHRDLKPGNILVTSGGPKLLDFGIAKLLSSESGENATTLRALTPEYASPEQVLGSGISTASDVYSLGVLLFSLLAGRLPYRVGATHPVELVRAICEEDPLWEPAGLIHGDLQSILAQSLRKEPERRYLSVEQFAADVRRYLEGLPVLARPDSFIYRARKFVVRRAVPLAALGAILAAVLAGALSTLAQSRRAEHRFNQVRSLAHYFLFDVYDSINALPGSLGARRLVVSRAQQYLDSLSQEATGDSVLTQELAESYLRLGDVRGSPYRANLGDTAGALESYHQAAELLQREAARHPNRVDVQERLVQARMSLGRIHTRQKNAGAAIAVLRQAIQVADALRSQYPQNLAYAEKLSRAYLYLGQAEAVAAEQNGSIAALEEARDTYRNALEIQQAAGPQTDESWQRSLSVKHFYLGYALSRLGDRTGDLAYHHQALDAQLQGNAIYRKLAAVKPEQSDAWIRRSLADGLADIGLSRWKCCRDLSGSLRDLREALARFQTIADGDPQNLEARRDLADAYRRIGTVLAEGGRRAEALEPSRQALSVYEGLGLADSSSGENAGYVAEVRARIAALERR